MNKLITFVTFFILAFATAGAQSYDTPTNSDLRKYVVSQNPNVPFRLFPTQNSWNFMKLDTRTGQIWMLPCAEFKSSGDKLCQIYRKKLQGP